LTVYPYLTLELVNLASVPLEEIGKRPLPDESGENEGLGFEAERVGRRPRPEPEGDQPGGCRAGVLRAIQARFSKYWTI
jgi:hypothetical protein